MELLPEMEEVAQEVMAASDIFDDPDAIAAGLSGIIEHLKCGEREYIEKNAKVDALHSPGKTLVDIVDQHEMRWLNDFMDDESEYRQQYNKNLDKSKGAMCSQIYRDAASTESDEEAISEGG